MYDVGTLVTWHIGGPDATPAKSASEGGSHCKLAALPAWRGVCFPPSPPKAHGHGVPCQGAWRPMQASIIKESHD